MATKGTLGAWACFRPHRRSTRRPWSRVPATEFLEPKLLLTAPVATGSAEQILHDQQLWSGMSGSDDDGDEVTFTVLSDPTDGTLNYDSDGTYDYTPNAGFADVDSFTFTVSAGGETSAIATVTIEVTNTVPNADGTFPETVLHDQTLWSAMSGWDDDEDDITFSVTALPTDGVLNFDVSTGMYDYTPNAGYTGTDSFTFTVSDGIDTSVPATIYINVYNTRPVASGNDPTSPETILHDQTLSNFMWGWDDDGDIITFSVTTGPVNGTATYDISLGSYDYTPNAGYTGTDSFTFQVSDGSETSDPATIHIDVYNTAPEAYEDEFLVEPIAPGEFWTIAAAGVLENDIDPDSDVITATLVTGPSDAASFTLYSDGSFDYEPKPDKWPGFDSFTYAVNDGIDSAIATAKIELNCGCDSFAGQASVMDEPGPDADAADPQFSVAVTAFGYAAGKEPTKDKLTFAGYNFTWAAAFNEEATGLIFYQKITRTLEALDKDGNVLHSATATIIDLSDVAPNGINDTQAVEALALIALEWFN